MFKFNGRTPKKILYNNFNVAKLVYNGVVVWMSKVLATIEGILPLTLTNSTGDDLVDYKVYGNTEEVLPRGYTQVEYIQGSGTQYIDIGSKMYNNSEIELCFSFDVIQQDCSIFGSRDSATVNNFEIASSNPNFPLYLDFGNYNTSRATYNNAVINTKYICTISKSLRAIYDENNTLLARNTILISANNVTPSNARIFDTAGGFSKNKLKGKVYYCKIWNGENLIRNFIPCKNPSNVAGMYDTVNGVFYTNAGTGSFNTGSVVSKKSVGDLVTDTSDINYGKYKIPILTNSTATNIYLNKPLRKTSKLPTGYTQVEHIRNTGTQYINTGVNLSNNSNIEINAKLISTQRNTSYYLFGSRIENKRYMIAVGGSTDKYLLDFINGNYRINSLVSSFDGKFHTHKVTNLSYYIDGILQGSKSSLTFTNTSSAYLFDVRGDGNAPVAHGAQSWEIKYCKIWNGNNLIRDFIPCKNPSNVIGMYDTVNDVFYSNAGSGSFIAGAEVETVYYTDYLDYENQKVVRNVDDNDKGLDTSVEESVVLTAVPTDEGTVTVDVDTEIAPSNMEVVYYKNGS